MRFPPSPMCTCVNGPNLYCFHDLICYLVEREKERKREREKERKREREKERNTERQKDRKKGTNINCQSKNVSNSSVPKTPFKLLHKEQEKR